MCPRKHLHDAVAIMLKAIHAMEDKDTARQKVALVVRKLQAMKLERIVSFIKNSVEETLIYMDFPYEHWSRLRTNNGLECLSKVETVRVFWRLWVGKSKILFYFLSAKFRRDSLGVNIPNFGCGRTRLKNHDTALFGNLLPDRLSSKADPEASDNFNSSFKIF